MNMGQALFDAILIGTMQSLGGWYLGFHYFGKLALLRSICTFAFKTDFKF